MNTILLNWKIIYYSYILPLKWLHEKHFKFNVNDTVKLSISMDNLGVLKYLVDIM